MASGGSAFSTWRVRCKCGHEFNTKVGTPTCSRCYAESGMEYLYQVRDKKTRKPRY